MTRRTFRAQRRPPQEQRKTLSTKAKQFPLECPCEPCYTKNKLKLTRDQVKHHAQEKKNENDEQEKSQARAEQEQKKQQMKN